mmetsp:Transcript_82417/g.120766  ORF Transcript_82417/g.120766 Transcript_82417/m.120766 type:complete len:206 (+) Transcript_82417:84-701(+)|eukprot:CAMPEP_0179405056 /NCGR_PEP_ID=MMETSP0799-20121207/59_1 /TAXON_ID=46947 /ORGANISM="Geminigera cryophila, Strain CCMP2564" /LENGTH=205 /DNA_ID=CAMNT_0021175831 /DNA_START=82 /DNA_END=699 /DNA_ORIENTATION=+
MTLYNVLMATAVALQLSCHALAFTCAPLPMARRSNLCVPGRPLANVKMGEWREASASIAVNAPMEDIWKVWSNFELMPRWQPWIAEVIVGDDSTSRWTLRKSVLGVPLSFSWTATELPRVENKLIHWEATKGLENKGRVDFDQGPDGVDVTMTISYKLPTVLALMFRGRKSRDEGGPVNAKIKKILATDLRRFKDAIENSPETFL